MQRLVVALALMIVVASSAQFQGAAWASSPPYAGRVQSPEAPVVQMAGQTLPQWAPPAGTQGVG